VTTETNLSQTPLDVEAVRSLPAIDAEVVTALCDELESLRESHAKLRALYDRNMASLINDADELDAANVRLKDRNVELKAELLAAEAQVNRLREALNGAHFVQWADIGLVEAKAVARHGRRLKERLHSDTALSEAWEVFKTALDASVADGGDAEAAWDGDAVERGSGTGREREISQRLRTDPEVLDAFDVFSEVIRAKLFGVHAENEA
jgi:hypothetical protein